MHGRKDTATACARSGQEKHTGLPIGPSGHAQGCGAVHLDFHAMLCVCVCVYYLLGGERLRPVVQNQPVFAEGFGL